MLVALIKTLRPRQWVKNSFVGVPLFFALRLFDVVALSRSAAAIALFCLISGCVYVLNDIVDAPQDRLHLQKRHRPIASGALPVGVAKTFLVVAVPLVIAGAVLLSPRYAAVLGGYFVLNIAYSFRLKRVAYLDVLCIATFFIMRVLAGAFAIDVEPSHWLLACTFLLATFLGFGKRAHELAASVDADKQRAALRGYDLASLRVLLHVVAALAVITYALYTRSEHTIATFGTDRLIWTVPFGVIGILRFSHLATTRHDAESPTEEMLRDPLFMANFLVYLAVTGAILYWS
ncbi:MAG: decaprenyl-phosphate phosphoribosyltransferase [Nannocystaceae bacterium]|nr:decaprenyl-phosphate phosphoribosyltransferase [Nannocystaceae bacterium]